MAPLPSWHIRRNRLSCTAQGGSWRPRCESPPTCARRRPLAAPCHVPTRCGPRPSHSQQPEGQAQSQSPAAQHTARAGDRTTLADKTTCPQREANVAGQSPRGQHSMSPDQLAQHGYGNVCDARTKLGVKGGHGLGLGSSWPAACCNNKITEEGR